MKGEQVLFSLWLVSCLMIPNYFYPLDRNFLQTLIIKFSPVLVDHHLNHSDWSILNFTQYLWCSYKVLVLLFK